MTEIRRLESANPDRTVGGVLFTFPSGLQKIARWQSSIPVDAAATAKSIVERTIQSLLDGGGMDDLERTNWVSAVAGVSRVLADWNAQLGAAG